MVEEVSLDGPEDNMSWVKWEAAVEESFDKEALVKKLRHLIQERDAAKRKLPRENYTYLDAVSRPGFCHVGLPTLRP